MLSRFVNFAKTDIWRIRGKALSGPRSFFVKQLRIIVLTLRGFDEDRCQLRASALTFYSLLSIVPVVALAFGIAKGFGFEKHLERQLLDKMPGQEEVLTRVIEFAHSLLEQTKGGIVAGVGIVVLFWTVIKVLGNVERSFNDIWGVEQARSFGRKLSDYLSVMLVCPIVLIVSSSATVFITAKMRESAALWGALSTITLLAIKLIPYCLIWALLTFVYMFMPNTKVRFRSAVLAGVVAGTIYQAVQWAYISFQIGVAKYNAIYGSFAALPLFLVWLQLSWLIVLFGAEISFAHQNVDTYEFEPDCLQASQRFKRLVALQITHAVIRHFTRGLTPLTAPQIAQTLEIPVRLVRQVLYDLVSSGVLSEVKGEQEKQPGYQPGRSVDTLTVASVIDALEKRGTDNIPVTDTQELQTLSQTLQAFQNLIEASPENRLLKDV